MSETKPSNKQDNIKQIDFNKIACVFKTEWRTYLKVLPATFLLSCLLILCVPRYYECNVSLAPELTNNSSLGSLAGMASAFGIDLLREHSHRRCHISIPLSRLNQLHGLLGKPLPHRGGDQERRAPHLL